MKALLLCVLLCPALLFGQGSGRHEVDSMVRVLPAMKEDTNKVAILGAVSFSHAAYNLSADTGIRYGQQALALATKLGWKNGIANAYNSIGSNYHISGLFDSALVYYQLALKVNGETGSKKFRANSLGNIGLLYHSQSNYPQALDHLFRALKIFEEIRDTNGITTQLCNIGSIYQEQKKLSKALEYDSIALATFRQLGDEEGVAMLLGNIGNIHDEAGNNALALKYDLESLEHYRKLGNTDGVARNRLNIGVIYIIFKKYNEALQSLSEALRVYEKADNLIGMGSCYAAIGDCYFKMSADTNRVGQEKMLPAKGKCLSLAISYAKRAIGVDSLTGSLNSLSFSYNILAQSYLALGNYRESVEAFLKYSYYKDSVYSVESNRKIVNLENQRELDIRESHIKILEQDNRLKGLSAEKARLANRLLLSGIVIVAVIAFSVVMYFVRRQRSEKLLANERINTLLKEQELKSVSNMLDVQENERKRIAADLHDRLGSMLSTVKLYFNSVEEQIDALKAMNKEQYTKATLLLDEACDEVRKISHNLVSGELIKFGLVSAVKQMKETIEHTGKLKMNVLSFGMDSRFDSAAEIAIYRIIQELMNNILKHSKATEVTIQFNRIEQELNIVVEDNGVGFDVNAALAKGGMGLKNLQTRVKGLNGSISFDSGKGSGTTTIIDILL